MDAQHVAIAVGVPLLAGIVASALALFALPAVAPRKRREGLRRVTFAWVIPALTGLAVLVGSWVWQSGLELWPRNVTQRFPAVAVAAAVVGLLLGAAPIARRWFLAAPLASLAAGFGAWAFIEPLSDSVLPTATTWLVIVGVGLYAAVAAVTLEAGAKRWPNWSVPAAMSCLIGFGALGATQGFANAPIVLGAPAGFLPGVFAIAAFASIAPFVKISAPPIPGLGAATAVLVATLAVFANWLGHTEQWLMFALILAAPLATAACLLPPLKKRGPFTRVVIAAIPAMIILGGQVARAVPELVEAMNPSDEYDYDY